MTLSQDPRIRSIRWKDLTRMTTRQRIIENSITIPWLLISCGLAFFHYYILALPFSFIFFLTGLRQVHNGFHYTLGVSRSLTEATLFVNSLLMMTAMHAVRYNHLRHHKYCLQEQDIEGNCARMTAIQALLYGPVFIYRLHASALRSPKAATRKAVRRELIAIVLYAAVVFSLHIGFLEYHIIAMCTGELFTAFFAVWTVHHDCEGKVFARSVSPRWKNWLTFNMFYHLEHHLFPGVPTIRLPELSRRIRKELPDLKIKDVF